MPELLTTPLANLKALLMDLKPTGSDGFEGLIAATLGSITGVPFRLASSGRQDGIDGKAVFEEGCISFEGKLYTGSIPRTEVITKIADISRGGPQADLAWVLGATSSVSTQIADDLRLDGERNGISVVILDWSDVDFPLLAVTLAMAEKRTTDFLSSKLPKGRKLKAGLKALDVLNQHPAFQHLSDHIKVMLNAPSLGTAIAQKRNEERFRAVLADKQRARDVLGQALAPGEGSTGVRLRQNLIDSIQPFLTGKPDTSTLAIIGREGNGKSWVAMQSWLELPQKPLLVFFTPDHFHELAVRNDIEALLIEALIIQTDDVVTSASSLRWKKRFSSWRVSSTPNKPRLIVVIDGVNQRGGYEWGRILGKVATTLESLGGRMLFTSREHYYKVRIKRVLTDQCHEVLVNEWTAAERDAILHEYLVPLDKLNPTVAETLRNPRLLAIATEIFGPDEVAAFEELSISRLLFEHIRAGARYEYAAEPVDTFVQHLRSCAKEILRRAAKKRTEDLSIFEAETPAVAEGRFFDAVEGEPRKYRLVDDGLSLALGFALAERLRAASRNGTVWESALEEILEPISALDDTSNVILAALTVVAFDELEYTPVLAKALVRAFATLQNPNEQLFPAMVGVAKCLPSDFFEVAKEVRLSDVHLSNIDWIDAALKEASKIDAVWTRLGPSIRRTLCSFSLDPKHGAFKHGNHFSDAEVNAEENQNREEITSRLHALSRAERTIRDELIEEEGNLTALARLIFKLLAGKPLAPFAKELVAWNLGQSLNPPLHGAEKEFAQLVCFNRSDWPASRVALLSALQPLGSDEISRTGKWALVKVLCATGGSEDASAAQILIDDLTKDFPHYSGGRLVEKYCATDPCDPSAQNPGNIEETAERYEEIDVSKLCEGMYSTSEDHFFRDARPGLVRFVSGVAIQKHREFADDVLSRGNLPLRQGLLELRPHNALLDRSHALRLIDRARGIDATRSEDKDLWLSKQYCLLLALPLLNPDERLKAFLSTTDGKNTLLDLLDVVSEPQPVLFEQAMHDARASGNVDHQYLLLEIARTTRLKLSGSLREYVSALPSSTERSLRAASLGVIAESDDNDLLSTIAKGPWTAATVPDEHWYELWYGSLALLRGAERGLIDQNLAVSRISPRLYGRAVKMLKGPAAAAITKLVDLSIEKVLALDTDLIGPDIEVCHDEGSKEGPIRVRLNEREVPARNIKEAFAKFSETAGEFEEKQRRTNEAYDQFRASLSRADALVVLDNLKLDEFKTMIGLDWGLAERWRDRFLALSDANLPAAYNLILLLAHAIGEQDPSGAEALFRRVNNCQPLVRFTFGKPAIDLGAYASWYGCLTPPLDRVRIGRLDAAQNDHELAMEVLAALLAKREDLILSYIKDRVSSEEPAEVARGLMVAGYCDENPTSDDVFRRFEGVKGLPGDARDAAMYAYERNLWSRHWYKKMASANDPERLWAAAILFLKIVDGRFSIWRSSISQDGSALVDFGSSLSSRLRNRYEGWEKKRKSKLFGRNAPEVWFLT